MILFRSVGLQEAGLLYDSGMKAFPARLPQQPIFYPVLQLEYARKVASSWNRSRSESAGYVMQFKMQDEYIDKFETHSVGTSSNEELWIPAEELDEFNKHIVGQIKVVDAYFRDTFEGFIPDAFGLQGQNAVDQFTTLANSFIYKRFDFYLEIKRNHKAVFLNYPFWLKHEFKNPGLKEKVIKAIREGWLTSFPQNPLMQPVQEDPPVTKETKPTPSIDPAHEEEPPRPKPVSRPPARPAGQSILPVQRPAPFTPRPPLQEKNVTVQKPKPNSVIPTIGEESVPVHKTESRPSEPAREEPIVAERQIELSPYEPVREDPAVVEEQPEPHFEQGVRLGSSGKYEEAIEELTKAVEQDPRDKLARVSLGVAFHRNGEDERALACYDAALKIDPHDAEAYYFRANILYSQGLVREAMADYTVAVGLEPALIDAHQNPLPEDRLTDYTGSSADMHRIARVARRILQLNKSLEANPGRANLLKERAAEYSRLRNYRQAIVDYTAALKLQPDDADAFHQRGVAYEQNGQPERALQDYQRAIAIDPYLSDTYIQRGITLGQSGNFRQSVASLTDGIRLAPQNPNGYFNRGISNVQQADWANAMADFSKVIQLSPAYEDAYYWRGIVNEQAGHQAQAIADYRKYLTTSRNAQMRQEVEQKLSQWGEGQEDAARHPNVVRNGAQDTNSDLHDLMLALGERAVDSTWIGSDLDLDGETADELDALTEQEKPVDGRDLVRLTAGISRAIAGDFQGFDEGAAMPWIFIRALEGIGFYVETDDPELLEHLKSRFPSTEDVQAANASYQAMIIWL